MVNEDGIITFCVYIKHCCTRPVLLVRRVERVSVTVAYLELRPLQRSRMNWMICGDERWWLSVVYATLRGLHYYRTNNPAVTFKSVVILIKAFCILKIVRFCFADFFKLYNYLLFCILTPFFEFAFSYSAIYLWKRHDKMKILNKTYLTKKLISKYSSISTDLDHLKLLAKFHAIYDKCDIFS